MFSSLDETRAFLQALERLESMCRSCFQHVVNHSRVRLTASHYFARNTVECGKC
jgi:hypothetical protein